MIDDLIESVMRRENGERGGGGGGRNGGGGGGHYGGGGGGDYGGRGGGGGGGDDSTFIVPANKCGIIIGRGGETIKQINQQSGAYCEMDRKSQHNTTEKNFNVKGTPEQIEAARRIICDKIGMQIKVISGGTGGGGGGGGGYGGGSGGSNPYAQQWGGGGAGGAGGQYGQWGAGAETQMPQQSAAGAGGADYSAQWIEYYRAMGMTREAEIIEQQLKSKQGAGNGPQAGPGGMPQQAAPQQAPNGAAAGSADYSAQWAEYYRAMGKVAEAEAIEKQMNANKVSLQRVLRVSRFTTRSSSISSKPLHRATRCPARIWLPRMEPQRLLTVSSMREVQEDRRAVISSRAVDMEVPQAEEEAVATETAVDTRGGQARTAADLDRISPRIK